MNEEDKIKLFIILGLTIFIGMTLFLEKTNNDWTCLNPSLSPNSKNSEPLPEGLACRCWISTEKMREAINSCIQGYGHVPDSIVEYGSCEWDNLENNCKGSCGMIVTCDDKLGYEIIIDGSCGLSNIIQ